MTLIIRRSVFCPQVWSEPDDDMTGMAYINLGVLALVELGNVSGPQAFIRTSGAAREFRSGLIAGLTLKAGFSLVVG